MFFESFIGNCYTFFQTCDFIIAAMTFATKSSRYHCNLEVSCPGLPPLISLLFLLFHVNVVQITPAVVKPGQVVTVSAQINAFNAGVDPANGDVQMSVYYVLPTPINGQSNIPINDFCKNSTYSVRRTSGDAHLGTYAITCAINRVSAPYNGRYYVRVWANTYFTTSNGQRNYGGPVLADSGETTFEVTGGKPALKYQPPQLVSWSIYPAKARLDNWTHSSTTPALWPPPRA